MKATDEQILGFVREFWESHGYAPTVREVAGAVGIGSIGGMSVRLHRMREDGLLTFADRTPRTLAAVDAES